MVSVAVPVSASRRISVLSPASATQSARGPIAMAARLQRNWILWVIVSVPGLIRTTAPPSVFVTHTEPLPTATSAGCPATGIRSTTVRDDTLKRETTAESGSAAQIESRLAASAFGEPRKADAPTIRAERASTSTS